MGENNDKWEEREQLLFRSTDFGDDKDRALQKTDGSWTYFASDVAYHKNKLDRKFDLLINILVDRAKHWRMSIVPQSSFSLHWNLCHHHNCCLLYKQRTQSLLIINIDIIVVEIRHVAASYTS